MSQPSPPAPSFAAPAPSRGIFGLLRRMYDWTLSWAETKWGPTALGVLAFTESSFFPIPPDVLLIPMVLARREQWLRYAFVCTVASVLGALLGYVIGAMLFEAIGRPIIAFYNAEDAFSRIQQWYDTWGAWGILFGAVTPFPYKILTIFSGFAGFNIVTLVVVSIVGRGFRFFLVGWLLHKFGEPIRGFIEKNLGLLFTLFMVLLVGGFVAIRYVF